MGCSSQIGNLMKLNNRIICDPYTNYQGQCTVFIINGGLYYNPVTFVL